MTSCFCLLAAYYALWLNPHFPSTQVVLCRENIGASMPYENSNLGRDVERPNFFPRRVIAMAEPENFLKRAGEYIFV